MAVDDPLPPAEVKLIVEGVMAAFAFDAWAHGARFVATIDEEVLGTQLKIGADRTWNMFLGSEDFDRGFTRDLAQITTCHELGHALGGFPFKDTTTQRTQVNGLEKGEYGTVSSSEGQSDYFASKDCLFRIWGDKTEENSGYRTRVSAATKARCDSVWTEQAERDLCYRIAAVTNDFAVWRGWSSVSTDTPSTEVPPGTEVNQYPSDQCRVDVLFAGALCKMKTVPGDIPGLVPPYSRLVEIDPTVEADAAHAACADGPGKRPRCWFRPNSTPYDCSSVPHLGDCVITDDGKSALRSCTPRMGITIQPCPVDSVCKVDEDGYPGCGAPIDGR